MDLPTLEQETGLYLLLEPSPVRNILRSLYELEETPRWTPLFAETPWASYPDESPLLVQTEIDQPFLQWALRYLATPDTGLRGLLLEATESLDPVAAWARERLQFKQNTQSPALLRYYDPLVWEMLPLADKAMGDVVQRAHYWSERHENWGISVPSASPESRVSQSSRKEEKYA